MIRNLTAAGISLAVLMLAACESPAPPPPPPAPMGASLGTPGQPAYSTGFPRDSEHGTVQR